MSWLEIPSEEEDTKDKERTSHSRAKKACDNCRLLKLKCDDEEPCSRCRQAGRACVRTVTVQPIRCRLKGQLACAACRQAKARCDEFRPCTRCAKMNRSDRCSEDGISVHRASKKFGWMEEENGRAWEEQLLEYVNYGGREMMGVQVVERPLPFVGRALSFDKPSGIRGRMNAMGWPEFVLARHWEFGFREEDLMRVFTSLPPFLEQVAREAMEALECLYHARQVQQQAVLCGMEEEDGDLGAMEAECDLMNYTDRTGWLLQGFSPSCLRRRVVFTNSGMGSVTGLHVEEFLARVANRELPILATELNFFCYVMYSSLMHATSSTRQLTAFSRIPDLSEEGGGRARLVKMVQERCLDWRGRLAGMRTYLCPVTKEEFDWHYQNEPNRFRPLAWTMGDHRSYEELMSDFPSDFTQEEVIANMAASKEGQQKLFQLALELKRLYAPLVQQAQRIKSQSVK